MNWSAKYPEQKQLIPEAAVCDLYVVGTQAANNAGSSHAFAVYKRDSQQALCPVRCNVSDGESSQERACLSGVIRGLQVAAPKSEIRAICRLENVVEAIKGNRTLRANVDLLSEIRELVEKKQITVIATRPHTSTHQDILDGLLVAAKSALAGGSLQSA